MLQKLKLKSGEMPSRKKPSTPPIRIIDSKKTVRNKPGRPALKKPVDCLKLKTSNTIPQSKRGRPPKNNVKSDSLNSKQRSPVVSDMLKLRSGRNVDYKSLNKSVGRVRTPKNSLSIVNNECSKVKRTQSIRTDSHHVNVISKQSIHRDPNFARPNRKTSTAIDYICKQGPKGHPCTTDCNGSANNYSNSHVTDASVDKPNKIVNIEETILDMQNKISKLEQKSVVDEENINNLKMILLKQRNDEIKMLLDEKQNELLLRMDLLYVDYEPDRACKLCLQLFDKKESLTSLLSDQTMVSLISSTLDMEVELNDGTPTGVCGDCMLQIKRYDWIKRRSQKAIILSKKFIAVKKGLCLNDSECPDKSASSLDFASSAINLLEHVIQEDITEEDQPLDNLKIEDAFSLDNTINVTMPLDITFIKEEPQTEDDKPTSLVVSESITSHLKPKTVKQCRRCKTIFTNQWTLNKHHSYCCQKFKCLECSKSFFDSKLFRMHKLRRQPCVSADVFRHCVICNLSFRWRWQLIFHVFNHKQQEQSNW